MRLSKRRRAWLLAIIVLSLSFAVDTASTLAAGPDVRSGDLNPLVRTLSNEAYVGWSLARLAIGAALLSLFWPKRLVLEEGVRHGWLAIVIPFLYREAATYWVAFAVMVIGPLKTVSSVSNLWVLHNSQPVPAGVTVVLGLILGVLVSNTILFSQSEPASDQ